MAPSLKTILLFVVATQICAGSSFAKKKLTKEPDEKVCGRTALQLKNCYLDLSPYSVRIWKQKISVSDKVARSLVDLPLTGEKVEWVTGRLKKLNGVFFLEWVAWEEPSAQSDIQTKNWYVYRLDKEKAALILTKPIVKRIKMEQGKPKSDHDIEFGIRIEKKVPSWFMGKEKGSL